MKQMKFLLLLVALLLTGCGDDGDSDRADYSDNGDAKIRIHNDSRSDEDIYYVYIKYASSSSWGYDDLDYTIDPGETTSWNISSCNRHYSIKIVFDTSRNSGTQYIRDKYIACGRSYTYTALFRY